ncbi:MAG TPA: alpha-amylase family glycosyl hydrolase, partial [Candidatus Eremiobacteraeota bacterium]|nr:alpha-amylase family glycosyl hydrolase [Candidatus Eremiobacteraeota bacterium]
MNFISDIRMNLVSHSAPEKTNKQKEIQSEKIQDEVSLGGHLPLGSYLTSLPVMKNSGGRSIISDSISTDDTVKSGSRSGNITTLSMFEGEGVIARSTSFNSSVGDQYLLYDGVDSSRDITGVTSEEGKPTEPYRFSVKLKDLPPGAEVGNLDLYLLISIGQDGKVNLPDGIPGVTNQPWNLAIGAYDNNNFNIYDEHGTVNKKVLKDLKFDNLNDTVSFALDKSVMREKGWKDGDPVVLQPFTTKDFLKKVIDTLDEPSKKPWVNNGLLSKYMSTDLNYIPSPTPMPSPSAPIPPAGGQDWRNESIYFILTDRFQDGDTTNNFDVNKKDLTKYHGGDLQGVIDKLDYIKDLGMSTVWITPTMANQDLFIDSAGYHGYWPVDFFKMDKHLGDMDKFKELINKAHEKGMKIILDIPLNHVAWEHPWTGDPSKQSWLHHNGDVKDWNDPWQVENCSMYGLPDLAQENPEVSKHLTDMAKWWIDQTGIDGFRLDAIKHVPLSFWSQFAKDIHAHAGQDFLL